MKYLLIENEEGEQISEPGILYFLNIDKKLHNKGLGTRLLLCNSSEDGQKHRAFRTQST